MKGTLARAILIVLLAAVAGAGCATPAAPAALGGRTFLSTQITDGGVDRPLVQGTQIRLMFQDGTRLGASAGCNTMGGTYRIANGLLVFEGGGMTQMGCDGPRHAQDDWLFGVLGSQPLVALSGHELVLTAGQLVLRFADEEVANPDLPLVGPVWTVDTIIDGDVAMGFAGPIAATLQFQRDGTVRIQTGCNQGSAGVTADGATLRFTDIVLTKRACDASAGQIEQGVLALLRADAVSWEITAEGLMLTGGGRGLGLRGG